MVKVLSFLKSYRIAVVVALFLMLVELFVELFHPLLIAKIIDDGILQRDLSVVIQWGAVMIVMSLVAFLSGVINSFFASHVSQSFGYDVRKSLFEKVQAFSFTNLSHFPTSSLITRMTNDVTQLQNTVFMSLRIMLRAPLLILGGMIMALVVNAKLALFLIITIPLMFVFLIWMMKKGATLFKNVQEKLDGVNSVMRENLAGMRLIKAFLRRKHEGKRFNRSNEDLKDGTIYALRLMEVTMPILLLVMNCSVLCVLWFGSVDVNTGEAQVGEVVAIVNYATRITSALSIFSFIIMAFSRARASAHRISDVLVTEIDLIDSKELATTSPIKEGEIEFKNVSFSYPNTSTEVLENLSFVARSGETVAILGATGSGKSSLFQLIPRLYDVKEGEILIDGVNLRQTKLSALRKQIGYVPQEALLFTGTVKENIGWGKEDASMEDIMEAAKNAQIHHTITQLSKGYDAVLGQKGVNLSGGQKQRLSIARALVRKPKILLLDDSTSALDLKTEAMLLQSLRHYSCTTLIITQKVSTAMEADSILLLEEGRILAEGNHEELLKQSELYQQIFRSQFGEEELRHAQAAN
ncbi:ABC transporter ATP-binding protein [Metabacillus herbersteinensis]|uniref:ABC transporter ATP-binding protein n=1 Tax=Metabacillus herbersteinensis TaxID=283816 RepID=A0ABV6GJH5_9BACI